MKEYYNYYEINVALNGKHFFATSKRSCATEEEMKTVYSALKSKFPESEGYSVEITGYVKYGRRINVENTGEKK